MSFVVSGWAPVSGRSKAAGEALVSCRLGTLTGPLRLEDAEQFGRVDRKSSHRRSSSSEACLPRIAHQMSTLFVPVCSAASRRLREAIATRYMRVASQGSRPAVNEGLRSPHAEDRTRRRPGPPSSRSSAMYLLSAICRLSAPVAVCFFAASVAVAETTTVGTVDKVQAQVNATQAGQTRALAINSDVYFRDRCHSTEGARLQATLKDGTQLALGENATVVVGGFVYDPFMSRGALSVRVIKGAFLFVGGRIEGVTGAKVQIHTPVAAIGVRGTTVWGGPIDNGYGIVVLSGEVT